MRQAVESWLRGDRLERLRRTIRRWSDRLPGGISEAAFGLPHRLGCLGACLAVIVAKAPMLLWEPRFWAEEGTVYFAYARHHTLLQSLFLVPTSTNPAGYLLLAANLPAALAVRLPLEHAPWATTLSALLVQAIPFAVVLIGHSHLWRRPHQRLVVCLILLFAPALVGEVWLNAINSQIFCGLIAVLILAEDLRSASRRRAWIYRGLLVFCGLSGPYTGLLVLAFVLKHRLERSGESRLQAGIVGALAAVQAALILWTRFAFALGPERFAWLHWGERAANVLYHQVVRAVVGDGVGYWVVRKLGLAEAVARGDIAPGYLRLAGWTSIVLVGLVLWWLARRPQSRYQILLPVSFLSLVLAIAPAIGGLKPGERYAVVPGILLLLMFSTHAVSYPSGARPWAARRGICRLLLATALVVGAATYWREIPAGALGRLPGKPLWSDEVATWRRDPSHVLAIWPYVEGNSWYLHLAPPAAYAAIRDPLSAAPFRLVSFGDWTERSFSVAGLPSAFKIVVDLRASQAAFKTDLRVRLTDRDGALLGEHRIRGFRQEKAQRVLIDSTRDLSLAPGRDFAAVRRLTVAMRATVPAPLQVTVHRLHLGPRVEGVLEPILPPLTVPTALYPTARRQPISGEATALLMTESLLDDGDAIFDGRDFRRSRERWPDGARGLRLRSTSVTGPLRYAGSPVFPLVSLPLFHAWGPAGGVLLNLSLFLAMMALAWRALSGERRSKAGVVLGFFLASAALGWIFLPQPQVLRMFCLFVPATWWIGGRLGEGGGRLGRPLVAGALVAFAALEEPWLACLGLAAAADLAGARQWRQLAAMGAGILLSLVLVGLCWVPYGGIGQFFLPAHQLVWEQPVTDGERVADWAWQTLVPEPAGEGTLAHRGQEAWRFFAARHGGLLPCYPFALAAVALFAFGREDRSRVLLFAVVVVVSVRVVWTGVSAGRELLGSGELAAIYPLFLLLPSRWSLRRALWLPLAVAFFFTLPVLDRVWKPPPETAGGHRAIAAPVPTGEPEKC